MRRHHPLKPHKPQLGTPQLIVLMVVTFAVTVLGGLYGPGLASRLIAPDSVLHAGGASGAARSHYSNCAEVHAGGVYSIPSGSPGYRQEWDGDGDGLACEPHRRR